MTSRTTRRTAAAFAALAVSFGGLTFSASAFAENGDVSGTGVVAVQHEALINLDPAARGTLTIDKRQRTDANGTTAGNGLPDSSVTGDPVAGVTYKIEKLTSVDLTTQAGWEKLAGYADVASAVADGVGTATSLTTGDTGKVTFSDLTLGAYVVTETSVPSGYTLSAPFIVTVPMTNPTDNTRWNYDPIVYPKNAKTEVSKTVSDAAAPQLGDTRTYTISADIPNLPAGEKLNYYQLVDQYDARLSLGATPADRITLNLATTQADGTLVPGAALEAGTDYTLVHLDTPFEASTSTIPAVTYQAKRVTAVFTEAGRAKILAARTASPATATKVVMTLDMTVAAEIGDNGVVRNASYVIPNEPQDSWDPATSTTPPPGPGDETESKYGKVKITKVSTDSSKLAGAEFQVFRCVNKDDSLIDLAGDNFVAGDYRTVGDPLQAYAVASDGTASATTTFVTDSTGVITIDALQNNDWENGATDDTPDAYCLIETKAPEGFELQTKPIAFQILQTNSTADNTYTLGTTVTNVPANGGFRLPLTGGQGVTAVLGAGGVLVAAGAGLAVVARRRKLEA